MARVRLLLAGDVMIGRAIDQVMASPLPPALHEPWVHDAREYVRFAEAANGPIPAPVPADYPWGDALEEIGRFAPHRRIVNLEVALTRADAPWPDKSVHYRANPAHVDCLLAAGIDACTLANNHVLDWGRAGLDETLATLRAARIGGAGAGADLEAAAAPVVLGLPDGARLLLFAAAGPDCGVPPGWAAGRRRPGIACLPALDDAAADAIAARVRRHRGARDIVVVSLHWGANWVDAVPAQQRRFAHRLIDLGAADLVHGHSAHHPLPIEVHAGRLVLHGCGDLINDYEGIPATHRAHRADLACLYEVTIDAHDGCVAGLELVPLQLHRFRLRRAPAPLRAQLFESLDAGCRALGARLAPGPDDRWHLAWTPAQPTPRC